MPRVMGDHEHRQRLYCTPAHVVRALLEREKFPGIIWEPAAGKGHIVRALRSYGYRDVVASDLNDWGFPRVGLRTSLRVRPARTVLSPIRRST